jgi:hypothetical protein
MNQTEVIAKLQTTFDTVFLAPAGLAAVSNASRRHDAPGV